MNARLPISRPMDRRLIGGVCSGLAARYRIDVTLLRLAFLLLAFASGIGVVLYAALWLAMPPRGTTHRAELRRAGGALRGRVAVVRKDFPRRHAFAVALIALGALVVLASFGVFAWLTATRVVGLVVLLVGAAMLVSLTGGKR